MTMYDYVWLCMYGYVCMAMNVCIYVSKILIILTTKNVQVNITILGY